MRSFYFIFFKLERFFSRKAANLNIFLFELCMKNFTQIPQRKITFLALHCLASSVATLKKFKCQFLEFTLIFTSRNYASLHNPSAFENSLHSFPDILKLRIKAIRQITKFTVPTTDESKTTLTNI
ncbi:MAG: hypothetical protein HW421_3019 [Ignavibacteria bacterium]|nr:hypothetical protein [Ignavibacteria bacterium]